MFHAKRDRCIARAGQSVPRRCLASRRRVPAWVNTESTFITTCGQQCCDRSRGKWLKVVGFSQRGSAGLHRYELQARVEGAAGPRRDAGHTGLGQLV